VEVAVDVIETPSEWWSGGGGQHCGDRDRGRSHCRAQAARWSHSAFDTVEMVKVVVVVVTAGTIGCWSCLPAVAVTVVVKKASSSSVGRE